VIQDVDLSVKALLVQKVPLPTEQVDVKFEMPTADWTAAIPKPIVNLFLFDVRENHELRSNQVVESRTANVATVTRSPVRIDLSYLITAWTTEVSDEHYLLGRVLATLVAYPFLPAEVLQGTMLTQPLPVPTWAAQPERTPNSWEFWSGSNGRLKAGISYVVTVAVAPFLPVTHPVVTEKILNVHLKDPALSG
jgi:hypothetical protein